MTSCKKCFITIILMLSITYHFLKRRPFKVLLFATIGASCVMWLCVDNLFWEQLILEVTKKENESFIQLLSVVVAIFGIWITFYTASTNWRREAVNNILVEINDKQSELCAEMLHIINENDFLASQLETFANNVFDRKPINDLNVESKILAGNIEKLKQRVEYASLLFVRLNAFKEQYNVILIRKRIYHLVDGMIDKFHQIRMEAISFQLFLLPAEPQFYMEFAERVRGLKIDIYNIKSEEIRGQISTISGFIRGNLLEQLMPTSFQEYWALIRSPRTLYDSYRWYKGEEVDMKKRYAQLVEKM